MRLPSLSPSNLKSSNLKTPEIASKGRCGQALALLARGNTAGAAHLFDEEVAGRDVMRGARERTSFGVISN